MSVGACNCVQPDAASSLEVTQTERLILRRLLPSDAPFILKLLNEPPWIQYIGDKGVRSLQDAQRYIENGPMEMYARFGFGLYLVELKEVGEPIGICGLIKRDGLDDVDLGFAFLSAYWGKGYALEAAAAAMSYGQRVLGLRRVVAILSQGNLRSVKLLEKLGFRSHGLVRLHENGEELKLYAIAT